MEPAPPRPQPGTPPNASRSNAGGPRPTSKSQTPVVIAPGRAVGSYRCSCNEALTHTHLLRLHARPRESLRLWEKILVFITSLHLSLECKLTQITSVNDNRCPDSNKMCVGGVCDIYSVCMCVLCVCGMCVWCDRVNVCVHMVCESACECM